MALHTIKIEPESGAGSGPSRSSRSQLPQLALAHGFTQNANCWGRFGAELAEQAAVTAVDLPGHGRSHHDDADLNTAGALLAEAGGPAIYIGYSMGGRTALHTALARPELVKGLVLIGATAGLIEPAERAARRAADGQLATRLLDIGLAQFLDRWLANPLFAGLDEQQAARAERLENRPEGLAASLRNCGTGTQEPLWARLAELAMPVLIIAGDQDQKFTTIGHAMADAMTGTSTEVLSIPGTHAVHLEKPEETAAAILARIKTWP